MSSKLDTSLNDSHKNRVKKRNHFREDNEIAERIWEIRQKTEKWKSGVLEQIDGQLNGILDDVLKDIEKPVPNGRNACTVPIDKENGSKVFKPRVSVLTELLEVTHIRTIYNIFVSLLVVFFLNTIVYDYIDSGRLIVDLSSMQSAFGKPSLVVNIWLVMLAMTFMAFPLFSAWVTNRSSFFPLPDIIWGLVYLVYMTIFAIFPVQEIFLYDIPPASSIIIITEQIRLMMKVHAFVRVNAEKVLKHPQNAKDKESDKEESGDENYSDDDSSDISKKLPGFGQYLYFLFVPTLIYRDHYPMTPEIRWDYVFSNFVQVVMCVFYTYYVFARYCVPIFRNTGKEPGNFKNLLLSTFSCMLPGTMVLVLGFFAILHSWLNAWAEMTRFADRMFYKDWWNCTSYAAYYREWNVVVHDWLYAYVYCDMRKFLKSRDLAAAGVFLISAVVHEYVLTVAFRFFFPVLFFMFAGFGMLFAFLSPPKSKKSVSHIWNIGMWLTLFLGNGWIMCLYSQEFYASSNCPRKTNNWWDQLFPRSWSSECTGRHNI